MCVTSVNPAKTAEVIEVPFGVWIRVDRRNHALDGGWISPGKGTLVGHSWVYPHMPTVDTLNVTRKGSTWDAGLSSKFFLWPLLLLIALLSLFAHKNLIIEKQLNATQSEGMRQNQIIVSWTIRLRTFTEAFGKYVSKNYKTRVEKQTHVFWTLWIASPTPDLYCATYAQFTPPDATVYSRVA